MTSRGTKDFLMSIKTILVHLANPDRVPPLLEAALSLPHDAETHVVGLYIIPPTTFVGAGMPGDPVPLVFDEVRRHFQSKADGVRAAFEEQIATSGCRAEWRQIDAATRSVLKVLLANARTADVVVAGQADLGRPSSEELDFPDMLALDGGRPVLIVPYQTGVTSLGRRVLVAWNGRREAARAVYDALPILQQADAVRVVAAKASNEAATTDDVRAGDICTALARHGVTCEASIANRSGLHAGHVLLAEAREFEADLLVMGCYGHSRVREFILGGATRHVLSHMQLPVLMSH
jgi:nucleotide-binding universal stress UspA family protein